MAWVKLDDQFFRHPKVVEAGRDARDLYLAGLCFCGSGLTDGSIPAQALRILGADADIDDPRHAASILVIVGLWEATSSGFIVHDYHDYQPSAEKVKADRVAAAERMRRGRSGEQSTPPSGGSPELLPNTNGSTGEVRVPRPSPVPVDVNDPSTATAVAGAGAPAREPAERGAMASDDFTPNENCVRVANELGLADEIDLQRQRFVDYCKAEGKRYKDHQAAFANWLRKEVLIRRERSGRSNGHAPPAFAAWTEVRAMLAFEAEHGAWPEEKPTDPALLAAVEALGGWRQIQDNDIHRGQFTRAYVEFARARA